MRTLEQMSATATIAKYDIKDITLADEGRRRTEWSDRLIIKRVI